MRYYENFKVYDITWFRYLSLNQLSCHGDFMISNYFYAGACGFSSLNNFSKKNSLYRLQFLRKLSQNS